MITLDVKYYAKNFASLAESPTKESVREYLEHSWAETEEEYEARCARTYQGGQLPVRYTLLSQLLETFFAEDYGRNVVVATLIGNDGSGAISAHVLAKFAELATVIESRAKTSTTIRMRCTYGTYQLYRQATAEEAIEIIVDRELYKAKEAWRTRTVPAAEGDEFTLASVLKDNEAEGCSE